MMLAKDRLFEPDPSKKAAAMGLYALVVELPMVWPHGRVDPVSIRRSQPQFQQ
jgi:glucuronate isomerase